MHVPPPGDPDGDAPLAPPGGYGADGAGNPGGPGFGPAPGPAPDGGGRALLAWLVPTVLILTMVAVLVGLGAFGMWKRIGAVKTAEVRNALGQIARDASTAYERELPAAVAAGTDAVSTDVTRRVCPAATLPVPADAASISGKKYQSSRSEWEVDKARNAGFSCLRFEMTAPQYYQYRYEATPTSFLGGGRGDLNGNGKLSDFTIGGTVEHGQLRITPQISETDPDE